MKNYNSNCYGFIHAGLLNSGEEFYLSKDEAFEGIKGVTKLDKKLTKIQNYSSESIVDCLSSDIDGTFSIIEIFDEDKKSQHVAFIDNEGNFYDQDGPDGEIRGIWGRKWRLEELLHEYNEKLGGIAYYQVHILNKDLSTKVENFLDNLQ